MMVVLVVVDAPATVVIVCVKIKAFGKCQMSAVKQDAWEGQSVCGEANGAFFSKVT